MGLENTNKPMVIVTTACHTNNFAANSLSESFINNESGGAIAYWGSSNYGWDYKGLTSLGPSPRMCAYFGKIFSETTIILQVPSIKLRNILYLEV